MALFVCEFLCQLILSQTHKAQQEDQSVPTENVNEESKMGMESIDEFDNSVSPQSITAELQYQHRPIHAWRWSSKQNKWKGRGEGQLSVYYNKETCIHKLVFFDETHKKVGLLQHINGIKCKYVQNDIDCNSNDSAYNTDINKCEVVWNGTDYSFDSENPTIGNWKIRFIDNESAKTQFMKIFNAHINDDCYDHKSIENEGEDEKNGSLDSDESECNETKQDKKQIEDKFCPIIINGTTDNFCIMDLQNIEYFNNYFASRWKTNNNDKSINIPICNDKPFQIMELIIIINYKKHNIVDQQYPFQRIKYLMNALDYFTEIIDNKTFHQYLLNYIPLIAINDIDVIMNACNGYDNENKSFLELKTAITEYKRNGEKMCLQIKNKFIEEWEIMSIDVMAKMKHISYQILMNTMKLIKVRELRSNISFYAPWDRDCEIGIEFLHKRSMNDLDKLWSAVQKGGNCQHLLNIISILLTSFLNRKTLQFWRNYSRIGNLYINEYKVVTYKHNVVGIAADMILDAMNILLLKNKSAANMSDLYNRFNDIVRIYAKAADSQSIVDKLYGKIIDAYFSIYHSFHDSIMIIFNDNFRNIDMLNDKFQTLSNEIKTEFLYSIYQLTHNTHNTAKDEILNKDIIKFFIENNKDTTMEYILNNSCNTFIIGLVSLFKQSLECKHDENMLSQLYSIMIDHYLMDSADFNENSFIISCECFNNTEILNRFAIIDENQKITFLNNLFASNPWIFVDHNNFEQKRNEVGSVLLKHNVSAAKQTFNSWFPILMIDQHEWIMNEILNRNNISFNLLKKWLDTITNELLSDKGDLIPQKYFDFVDHIF